MPGSAGAYAYYEYRKYRNRVLELSVSGSKKNGVIKDVQSPRYKVPED